MAKIDLQNIGEIAFLKAWEMQKMLVNSLQKERRSYAGHLLFCTHPPTFTLGKNGNSKNLLISTERLKELKTTFVHTDRGGDITFHGPGQIIAYPILNLKALNIGLRKYICNLEEVVIRTIATYGLIGQRQEGDIGVWLTDQRLRKICAIGVKNSRFVTMHGCALNVNTELSYFNHINPCGFSDRGTTSMQKELGMKVDFVRVENTFKHYFQEVFNVEFININLHL